MSDSVRPHRRQPTRLLRRWDSPGKNTGVGCHFLLQCMKVKRESEVAQSCPTLSMDCSLPGSSIHGIFQARVLEWGATAFSKHLCFISINFVHLVARCVLRQVLLCHFGSRKFSCEKHTVVWQGKAIGDFLRCTLKVWLFAHFKCEGFFFPLSSPCPSISDAGQLYRIQGKRHLLELCCT